MAGIWRELVSVCTCHSDSTAAKQALEPLPACREVLEDKRLPMRCKLLKTLQFSVDTQCLAQKPSENFTVGSWTSETGRLQNEGICATWRWVEVSIRGPSGSGVSGFPKFTCVPLAGKKKKSKQDLNTNVFFGHTSDFFFFSHIS